MVLEKDKDGRYRVCFEKESLFTEALKMVWEFDTDRGCWSLYLNGNQFYNTVPDEDWEETEWSLYNSTVEAMARYVLPPLMDDIGVYGVEVEIEDVWWVRRPRKVRRYMVMYP